MLAHLMQFHRCRRIRLSVSNHSILCVSILCAAIRIHSFLCCGQHLSELFADEQRLRVVDKPIGNRQALQLNSVIASIRILGAVLRGNAGISIVGRTNILSTEAGALAWRRGSVSTSNNHAGFLKGIISATNRAVAPQN